jgi:hypothetical protein
VCVALNNGFLHLVVSDIETAREELIRKGVDASVAMNSARVIGPFC